MTPKQRQALRSRRVIELVQGIAQEAHLLGRLYAHGGEKRLPGEEWEHVHTMAALSLRAGRVMYLKRAASKRGEPKS